MISTGLGGVVLGSSGMFQSFTLVMMKESDHSLKVGKCKTRFKSVSGSMTRLSRLDFDMLILIHEALAATDTAADAIIQPILTPSSFPLHGTIFKRNFGKGI